jgi:hypothetical protein
MIEKERLEELIEQGATIYWIYGKSIEKKTLKHKYHSFFICDNELNEYNAKQYIGIWKHKLSKLFETQEEAKWFAEFGCIERTERLELPTWEEIQKDKNFHYIRYYHPTKDFSFFMEIYKFANAIRVSWSGSCRKTDPQFDRTWELTKENYTLACRKAKELFLGEKK